ncbi:uncharacterized protein LOC121856534, partial [Homarus americanus]|uniref:uncharacterized protein LOC121856534 n=1 Tax=Homarus americanus TaxID=6706 RepID=UPI001C457E83
RHPSPKSRLGHLRESSAQHLRAEPGLLPPVLQRCQGGRMNYAFTYIMQNNGIDTWERQIRTVKKVLQAIVGSQVLGDERLQTLFCEVEAIVNERPITPVPNTPNEPKALTPADLLHLSQKGNLPLGGRSIGESYHRKWKHVQYLADQFWKRWLTEYLPQLRTRQVHFRPRRNFRPGDLIIIAKANSPRNKWHLGRVMEVKAGKDGLVRQAVVKTMTSTMLQPVTKLCLLEGAMERVDGVCQENELGLHT